MMYTNWSWEEDISITSTSVSNPLKLYNFTIMVSLGMLNSNHIELVLEECLYSFSILQYSCINNDIIHYKYFKVYSRPIPDSNHIEPVLVETLKEKVILKNI